MNEYLKIKYKLYKDNKLKHTSYSQIIDIHRVHEVPAKPIKKTVIEKIERDVRWYKNYNKECTKIEIYIDNELFNVIDLKQPRIKIKKIIKETSL